MSYFIGKKITCINYKMSVEYKEKSNLIDLYGVLGLTPDVCTEPDCAELIHGAYLKKIVSLHPDKNRHKSEADQKTISDLFQLVQGAYDILKDEKQRTNYNHKLKLDKQSSSSFFKLKQAAEDYADGGYKEATPEQKLAFKAQKKLMNEKYGYVKADSKPIPEEDAKKRLQSQLAERATQDIDLKPEKIFEGDNWDPRRFNEAFDLSRKQSGGSDMGSDIMPSNGAPLAWNGAGAVANFSNFDNLDNLFVEDSTRFDTSKQTYSGIDFGPTSSVKITKDFVSGLSGADYYDTHADLDDNYYADMKKKLSERQSAQSSFEQMGFTDFNREDTAGYGIFDQLGFKFDDRLTLDLDDDDISARFDKIMADRQKTILPESAQNNPAKSSKSNKSKK